jgi:hypothetical protein
MGNRKDKLVQDVNGAYVLDPKETALHIIIGNAEIHVFKLDKALEVTVYGRRDEPLVYALPRYEDIDKEPDE